LTLSENKYISHILRIEASHIELPNICFFMANPNYLHMYCFTIVIAGKIGYAQRDFTDKVAINYNTILNKNVIL